MAKNKIAEQEKAILENEETTEMKTEDERSEFSRSVRGTVRL